MGAKGLLAALRMYFKQRLRPQLTENMQLYVCLCITTRNVGIRYEQSVGFDRFSFHRNDYIYAQGAGCISKPIYGEKIHVSLHANDDLRYDLRY